jgi:hypothetical protein
MKYFIVLVLLASCLSPRRVDKYLEKHPEVVAKNCAEVFPCDTIVNYAWDTINTVSFDTINNYYVDTLTKEVVRIKVVNKIRTIEKTRTIENTARVAYLQIIKTKDSIEWVTKEGICNKERDIYKGRIRQLRAEIYSFLLALILALGFIIYKQLKRV